MSNKVNITLSERLNGVGEYYFSKKLRQIDEMRSAGRSIISLGIGSPDMPPHASVIERLAIEAAKPNSHGYQAGAGIKPLREAFSKWYHKFYGVELGVENVLPLIGSKEGLMHIAMTYITKGDRVLIPNPGYPTYRSAFTLAGAELVEYNLLEENDYQIDFAAIERGGLERVKIMVVNYPHMPTGTKAKVGLFEELVAFARKHNILLVHDNPYSFIRNDKPMSLLSVDGALDVAIELNSLSKSHNMAGWRIGAIFADKERIAEIMRFKSNMDSGTFLPMQLAAVEALSLGEEWFKSLNEVYRKREKLGYEIVELLGCKAKAGQAGLFIWGRLPQGVNCYDFIDEILEKDGIFITPGGIFGSNGESYIRISLCAPEETLEKVIEILKNR